MSILEIEEHHITKNIEYFGHLEPFKSTGLPSNSIIFKTLPGFGATFWEIYYKERHSIIIEPHVPVINGKQGKHAEILGVHKKISKAEIKEYLDSDIHPKKIITTPEGYIKKVKPVIESHKEFDLFKDFFMLFDECDRLITDVNYRGKIIAPMDDFFLFDNKAMVSATAIIPSDERFLNNEFKIIKLIPDYDYKKDLTLISSNNIVSALRHTLNNLSDQPVFIFLNSTLTIYAIIELLGIKEQSKVFCAEDSVSTLAKLKFFNTSTELGEYARFNFLTSRFFSAVDIDLHYKPDVIMVTDVYQASHSILDPMTEIIQISGRFRKKQGSKDKITVSSLTHITNYKYDITFKDPNEALKYINSAYKAYSLMVKQKDDESEEGAKDTYQQGFENTEIGEYVTKDHLLNRFMVDNYLHQQRVRSYYRGYGFLLEAYNASNYFNIKYESLMFKATDEDNMKLALAGTKIKITEAVAELMKKYTTPHEGLLYKFYDPQTEINKLKEKYPDEVEAYLTIGYDSMKALSFKMHLINPKVAKKRIELARFDPAIVNTVHIDFGNESFITETDAIKRLQIIYTRFNLEVKVCAKDLKYYFNADRTTNKVNKKGYSLKGKII